MVNKVRRMKPERRSIEHGVHAFVRPVERHPGGQVGVECCAAGADSLCACVHSRVADYVTTQYVPPRRKVIWTRRWIRLATIFC